MSLYLEIPEINPLFPFKTFTNEGWSITYPHWHKEIEFIYCLEGTVRLGVDDEIIQMHEDEIYFFSSGEPHFFLSSPNSERIVYQFDIKLFQGHDNISPNDRPLAKVFETVVNYSKDWPTPIQKEIQTILLSIYHENQKQREGYQYSILSSLYKLANLLYQLPLKNKKTEKAALDSTLKNRETLFQIDTILDYIESNYLHAITIQDVADHVGFSPSYFSRFFKKNIGMSFTSYLAEYRIHRAKYILGTELVPMAEVAARSGFSSVKTFHHVFKSMVGTSPMKFQKNIFDFH
ncbi:AraC family transcriptional regulator [Enterococcus gallinarum]|uniref:AraC family transcriptional regulator n=1 Tax=Enterococcus gallinarum TaxID=1353 RepID=UPI00321AF3A2